MTYGKLIPWLNDVASGRCMPDLTIFYDLDPGLGRRSEDYVERFGPELVRQAYLENLDEDGIHSAIIPARDGGVEEVHRLTVGAVRSKLLANI